MVTMLVIRLPRRQFSPQCPRKLCCVDVKSRQRIQAHEIDIYIVLLRLLDHFEKLISSGSIKCIHALMNDPWYKMMQAGQQLSESRQPPRVGQLRTARQVPVCRFYIANYNISYSGLIISS